MPLRPLELESPKRKPPDLKTKVDISKVDVKVVNLCMPSCVAKTCAVRPVFEGELWAAHPIKCPMDHEAKLVQGHNLGLSRGTSNTQDPKTRTVSTC